MQQIREELLQKGVKEDRILSINCEDFQYASITDAQKFYEYICQKRTSMKNIISSLMRFRWWKALSV